MITRFIKEVIQETKWKMKHPKCWECGQRHDTQNSTRYCQECSRGTAI